jgi:CHAD domain-containing protein/CYTH domain-containing protein
VPKYPVGQLDRTPAEAVAALAGVLLDEARVARARLEAGADDEALHDFRVALRRLRSLLRAFQPYVQHEVTPKLRRRLRDLARATNGARDAEVQTQWVESRQKDLKPTERIGSRWFLEQLADNRDRGYDASQTAVERAFPRLDQRVRKSLDAAVRDPEGGRGKLATFAAALEELVRNEAATLQQQLGAIDAPENEPAVHAARIGAKRLRYLLELIADESEPAARAVEQLREIQTVLGELHDAQVVSVELAVGCEQAAAEHARRLSGLDDQAHRDDRARRRLRRRNATPGMLALVRRCREAHRELFQQFKKWRRKVSPKLFADAERILAGLGSHAGVDLEVERKYLLRALPEAVSGVAAAEIDQGWLPGERLLERVRRVKTGDGERYFRTVKLGSGLTRIEIEEEASARVFEQLWPLTEGRRVHKRRYGVPEGDLLWEIDEFLDRELLLAEVELPSPDTEVSVPAWLEAVMEREVTGEAAYVNVNLAG